MRILALIPTINTSNGFSVAARRHTELLGQDHAVFGKGDQTEVDVIYVHTSGSSVRCVPADQVGKPVVGYRCVESSKANPSVVEELNKLTQIWTPSEASAAALRGTGTVAPVFVIPHPIAPPIVPLPSRVNQPFTVLTILAGPLVRKAPELSFTAFQTAFPIDRFPDVRWLLKARSVSRGDKEVLEKLISVDSRATLLCEDVGDIYSVYSKVDVLLHLHHAGAFEMCCAEAATAGIPVIATNVGGVKDYLPDESLVSSTEIAPMALNSVNNAGTWRTANTADAATKLLTIHDDLNKRAELARKCRDKALAECDPKKVLVLMNEALSKLPITDPSPISVERRMNILAITPPNIRSNGFAIAAKRHVDLLSKGNTIIRQGDPAHNADVVYVHLNESSMSNIPSVRPGTPIVSYWCIESSEAAPMVKGKLDTLQQVWTPSEASAAALRGTGTSTPVFVVPHPISAPAIPLPSREGQPFTVLTIIAGPLARKNPEAAFLAFQTAFPIDRFPDVRWVLKVRRLPVEAMGRVHAIAIADRRVHLNTMDVSEVMSLYAEADVFLSLHHAGAFEMCCAEAAIYGLPVIATKVGGVIDYLPPVALVAGVEIDPLPTNEINKAGKWIDPNINIAVSKLRSVYWDEHARRELAMACQKSATKTCDPNTIAKTMQEALNLLKVPEAGRVELTKNMRLPSPSTPEEFMEASKPNHMRTIRVGFEVVGGVEPTKLSPIIASHRRSGTHHMGEFIRRNWKVAWFKSHDMPERLPLHERSSIFMVRNPFDAIHSTWRWFSSGGGSKNLEIMKIMNTITFEGFLNGEAGRAFGYRKYQSLKLDNLAVHRGMFYDPVCFWVDQLGAFIDAQVTIITHEQLIRKPLEVAWRVADTCFSGVMPVSLDPVTDPVGLGLTANHTLREIGSCAKFWPQMNVNNLKQVVEPLLPSLGFANLEEWVGK